MPTAMLAAPAELGTSIPPNTPHAVSVSLPKWIDNVDYEEGKDRVVKAMVCGYPRFFIHKDIQKLMDICLTKFGTSTEKCLLMPSRRTAERCRDFVSLYHREQCTKDPCCNIRIAELSMSNTGGNETMPAWSRLYAILFPANAWPFAKAYWQHTGEGISSRYAEYFLRLLESASPSIDQGSFPSPMRPSFKNHRYTNAASVTSSSTPSPNPNIEHMHYIEERYGRNLNLLFADEAKLALRRRIAGALSHGDLTVSDRDVFLMPTGMSAIFNAHRAVLATRPQRKAVCFGFPYTDTLKILQKFGPGCHFFGNGEDADLDNLEKLLEQGERILALFCEFPSNPLLKSPDLRRIRSLANKYEFLVVVDETIGNFLNVHVLPYVDIIVSSLTKVFSGDSNVMGGSLVLNPASKYYTAFASFLDTDFEDNYWMEDAIFMERNSRIFRERIAVINQNAITVCEYLSSHPLVQQVYYPKYISADHYSTCMHSSTPEFEPGYGGLFSIVLNNPAAASVFFDALPFAKGPSLGTSFTLASPYTILAHYLELDWAEEFGVSRNLIRFSIGLENEQVLLAGFKEALSAAANVH